LKYKGNTPVKTGDKVDLMVDSKIYATVKVVDTLATQFTIKVKGKVRFFFYEDRGVTWQTVND